MILSKMTLVKHTDFTKNRQIYTNMAKHRYTFPIKGIEALIELVKKHDLLSLQVEGIVIVPRTRPSGVVAFNGAAKEDSKGNKIQRTLTSRDIEDLELFGGPNSISGPIITNLVKTPDGN